MKPRQILTLEQKCQTDVPYDEWEQYEALAQSKRDAMKTTPKCGDVNSNCVLNAIKTWLNCDLTITLVPLSTVSSC